MRERRCPTDTWRMTWLERELRWLLEGKNVYLARADAAGLTAFGEFLHFQGIPFVIDERGDAVVFSCDRLSEWWTSATEAA